MKNINLEVFLESFSKTYIKDKIEKSKIINNINLKVFIKSFCKKYNNDNLENSKRKHT